MMQTETLPVQTVKEQPCPNCQHTLEVNTGYATWCDRCGWNLKPQEPSQSGQGVLGKMYDSMYEKIGKRFSHNLYEEVVREQSVKPRMTFSKIGVLVLSLLVHAVTLGLVVVGIWSLIALWPRVPGFFWAVVCLGLAFLMRPRLSKMPKKILPRQKFPMLYKIVDDISAIYGTSSVAGIAVDSDFNASFNQVGWKRKKVITLGLPLFSIMEGQEKVALLAHEIGHGVNGDIHRSFLIWNALNSLNNWYYLLQPVRGKGATGLAYLGLVIANVVMRGLRWLIWAYAFVLVHLGFRESQRAEYLADSLSAEASGTDAVMRSLDKSHLGSTYWNSVQKAFLNQKTTTFFAEFKRQIEAIPEREWERIRRVRQMESSRLDVTHPPTGYRIGFMKSRQVDQPKYVLSEQDLQQLEKELAPLRQEVEKHLLEWYQRMLYR